MTNAVRALLGGAVDYAGLFPPAQLDMQRAVENYAAYRIAPDAWMLGRFVVPVSRLPDFASAVRGLNQPAIKPWPVSVLLDTPAADVHTIDAFVRANGFAQCDSVEVKAATSDEIVAIGDAVRGHQVQTFVEVPINSDPSSLIDAIASHGLCAKVRTGGVVPSAIPHAIDLARFLEACVRARVTFKATAGLHHPIRAEYALTYAPDGPRGVMFGFLNVFLAAALLHGGASFDDAVAMLEETDSHAIQFAHDELAWRDRLIPLTAIESLRRHRLAGFGSCSFTEPVNELAALHIA